MQNRWWSSINTHVKRRRDVGHQVSREWWWKQTHNCKTDSLFTKLKWLTHKYTIEEVEQLDRKVRVKRPARRYERRRSYSEQLDSLSATDWRKSRLPFPCEGNRNSQLRLSSSSPADFSSPSRIHQTRRTKGRSSRLSSKEVCNLTDKGIGSSSFPISMSNR